MKIATFAIEQKIGSSDKVIIGVDEAGRGPLAGPVVAGAVIPKNINFSQIDPASDEWKIVRDSKTLSEKQRETAFDFVTEHFHVGVGISNADTIDRMNILEATFLAMKKAINDVASALHQSLAHTESEAIILIDGNQIIPNFSAEQYAVPQGDGRSKTIAAASIIAKVTRDRMMLAYDKEYPEYKFAKHKGYGTKVHMEALTEYGPCPIHRNSFAPVRRAGSKKYEIRGEGQNVRNNL